MQIREERLGNSRSYREALYLAQARILLCVGRAGKRRKLGSKGRVIWTPGLKETNQTKHHLIAAKSKRASRKREKAKVGTTARHGTAKHTYMAIELLRS